MISKELLSEVLKTECVLEIPAQEPSNLFRYIAKDPHDLDNVGELYINIYELAHKCKEWAAKQGYEIFSYTECDFTFNVQAKKFNEKVQPKGWSYGTTEPDAVFKATQWVLENQHD